jgi:hypothetical protein
VFEGDEKDACAPQTEDETTPGQDAERPGLPDKESVVSEKTLVSPKGRRYRILKTNERDAYDPPVEPAPRKKRRRRAKG